jgi:hypothetical protein
VKTLDIEEIYSNWNLVKDGKKGAKSRDAFANINRIVKETYNDYSSYRSERASIIEKNIYFYQGEMHLKFDSVVKNYRIKPRTKYNEYIPRPVTNLIQPRVDTIASLFSRKKPQGKVLENSSKREDINKARMGDWLLDAKWEIDNETINSLDMILMALLAGTTYRKDGWDNSSVRSILLEKGKKKVQMGDTYVDIFSPLEIIADYNNGNRDIDKGDFIMQTGISTVEKLKREFDIKEKGYTGLAKNIKKDPDVNYTLSILNRLKTTTQNQGEDVQMDNACLKTETYIRPIKDYEKGLLIYTCGDEVAYIDECKYTNPDGTNWNPYSEFQWSKSPFSHLGLSLVEMLTSLNERYNAIDALIILNRRLNVSPQWVYKIGSLIAGQQFSGAPSLKIGYKGNTPPERLRGMPLDSSVWKEKEDIKQRMTEIAGDNEVLSGVQPSGVNTASQMNMLLEQSYGKFNPKTQRWEKMWEKAQTKKLNNMQKFVKEKRPEIISQIQHTNPKVPRTVIEDFFTDDGIAIGDNLQVRIETGSSLPRSDAYIKEMYKELAAGGLLGNLDPAINPVGNREFLKKMNIDKFPTQENKQQGRAEWENDAMRQGKFNEVELFPIDNASLHYVIHISEILEPEFFENNEEDVIMAFIEHTLKHYVMLAPEEKQMLQINPSMDFQLMMIAQGLEIVDPYQQMQQQMMQPAPQPVLGQGPIQDIGNMPAQGMPLNTPGGF